MRHEHNYVFGALLTKIIMFITCVMATGEIVGSIFLAIDELLRVEELAISSSPDFVNNSRLKIYENSTRDMLPSSSFAEECVECIISCSHCSVTWHLAISLDEQQN